MTADPVAAQGPLAGLRVIEVGVAMAAPFASMVLADMGADVVKIERIGAGDDSRAWPPYFHGELSHYFAAANRSKRSVALDLKSPEGAEILRRLADDADVLIQNYRAGALERAGLGYEALAERNPRLIYCSISGFGETGPKRGEPANDLFMQAYSGGMSVTGEAGGAPVKMGISVADVGAGLFAAVGILGALEARRMGGRGQHVTTSLLAGQLAMLSYHLSSYFASGIVPHGQGSGTGFGVPYQAFRGADAWFIVAVFNETMWQSLCTAMDRPDWAANPDYASLDLRVAHREQLLAELTAAFAARTAGEWVALLKAHAVPCTLINTIDQVVEDEQVRLGGMITALDAPGIGQLRMAAAPVRFSASGQPDPFAPPRVGEHTRGVLAELGFSAPAIDRLVADGVAGGVAAGVAGSAGGAHGQTDGPEA
jgi:crotonobetainyl-CoA:carnitine CoA-transferase CaiB-like acyl-CoA transferase